MAYAAAAARVLNMANGAQSAGWVSACAQTAPAISSILFIAPMPTIQKIVATKSVGDLPLLPYSSMVANAFLWTMYGLLKSESKIILPNAFGFCMGLYYSLQFSRSCSKHASNLPGTVSQHKTGASLIIAFAVLVTACLGRQNAVKVIGKLGVVVCIVLFASPLAALKTVIQTKSAESIPLPFTLVCLLNCFLWSVAGLFEMKDFYVYFPNLLGFASAAVQLFLRIFYGSGANSALPF